MVLVKTAMEPVALQLLCLVWGLGGVRAGESRSLAHPGLMSLIVLLSPLA